MAVDSFARSLSMAAVGNSYSKEEINKMFGEAGTVQVEAVTALPVSDIKENVIYLLAQTTGKGDNYHDEYMYVNNKWELIGTTEIDLSSYATKEELEEAISTELQEYVTKTDLSEALKNYATREDLPIYTLEDLVEGEQFKFYQTPNNNKTGDLYAAITVKMIGLKKGIFIPYYNGKLYYNVMFRHDTCDHSGYNPYAAGGFYIILRDITGDEAVQTDLAVGWNENYSGASIYYLANSSGYISNRYLGVQFSTFAKKTDIPSLDGLATEEYVNNQIEENYSKLITIDLRGLDNDLDEIPDSVAQPLNELVTRIEAGDNQTVAKMITPSGDDSYVLHLNRRIELTDYISYDFKAGWIETYFMERKDGTTSIASRRPGFSFHKNNDGSLSSFFYGVNYRDETPVLTTIENSKGLFEPTAAHHPTNKNYVDTAINNLHPEEFLRALGHVDTEADLPYAGQKSAEVTDNSYVFDTETYRSLTDKVDNDLFWLEDDVNDTYYLGTYAYAYSERYDDISPMINFLSTNFPEVIDGIAFNKDATTSKLTHLFVHVSASSDKPVHLALEYIGDSSDTSSMMRNACGYIKDDGTITKGRTITSSAWLAIPVQVGEIINERKTRSTIYSNIPNIIPYKNYELTEYVSGAEKKNIISYTLVTSPATPVTSVVDNITGGQTFVYADGMAFVKFDENKVITFALNNSAVPVNSLYAVGENNDLFRLTPDATWEQLAKSSGGLWNGKYLLISNSSSFTQEFITQVQEAAMLYGYENLVIVVPGFKKIDSPDGRVAGMFFYQESAINPWGDYQHTFKGIDPQFTSYTMNDSGTTTLKFVEYVIEIKMVSQESSEIKEMHVSDSKLTNMTTGDIITTASYKNPFMPFRDSNPVSKAYADIASQYRLAGINPWIKTSYDPDEIVFYDGLLYKCKSTIPYPDYQKTPVEVPGYWEVLPEEEQITHQNATKADVKNITQTLYFEGDSNQWNALTAEEQDGFLISLVEPVAETTEDIEETLQAIFLDETPTETEDDLTEDEANIQLDRIIEGGTI